MINYQLVSYKQKFVSNVPVSNKYFNDGEVIIDPAIS